MADRHKILASLAILLCVASAAASHVIRITDTLGYMTKKSRLIVIGTVKEVRSLEEETEYGTAHYKVAIIDVSKTIKGDIDTKTIWIYINEPSEKYKYSREPFKFRELEKILVFLQKGVEHDPFYRVTLPRTGKMVISKRNKKEIVIIPETIATIEGDLKEYEYLEQLIQIIQSKMKNPIEDYILK